MILRYGPQTVAHLLNGKTCVAGLTGNPHQWTKRMNFVPAERLPFYAETFVVVSPTDQKTSNSTEFLDVTFEMWPLNIEQGSSKDDFGKKLRHEWRKVGIFGLKQLRQSQSP